MKAFFLMSDQVFIGVRRRSYQSVLARAKDEGATQRVGPLRKNLRVHHEGKCGTKDLCGGQPLIHVTIPYKIHYEMN
jgi:hypothetical protein